MKIKKRVFIIDDEIDLTRMLGYQFESQGFEVQTASDGLEALKRVDHFNPDLIILDINMPRMGGIEFYSKICGPNGKPHFPVLVLTARANIKGLFEDLQIDGFMIKPFEIDQLVYEAGLIIKKRSQQAPASKSGFARGPRKICIVDQDQKVFGQLCHQFLCADYTVMPARSGAVAVEKIMHDVPDAALVHLGLTDMPGDLVIYRLSQMSKTMDVKFVLYTSKTAEHNREVMERIRAKTGILTFVEYNHLEEILDAVNKVLSS